MSAPSTASASPSSLPSPASAISPATPHLLIAFAGRSTPDCQRALATLQLPKLEALLARLAVTHEDMQDAATLSPPHERALAAVRGIEAADGLIPWAALEAREAALAGTSPADSWGMATLCHFQVGMDDVVLGDPAEVAIDAAESAALLAAARPFFEEDGIALHASTVPGRWLLRSPAFDALPTASIDRAIGSPISQWSPMSAAARPLLRLQNEMQMLLYNERVNDERTERGALPINSFWLSATGRLPASLAQVAASPTAASSPSSPRNLIVADALRAAALHDDGAAWAEAWRRLDAGPVADLLAACAAGADVSLTLCGDRAARRYGRAPGGLVRWAKSLFQRPSASSALEGL